MVGVTRKTQKYSLPGPVAYIQALMARADITNNTLNQPARVSFWFILMTVVLVGWLHLATPFLSILFGYLALTKLHFFKRWGRWPAVVIFLVMLAGVIYGLGSIINEAVQTLPAIADEATPKVIQWAKEHKIELPAQFTDFDSLKDLISETVKTQVHYLGSAARIARGASAQFAFLIIAVVVAISVFLNPRFELDRHAGAPPKNFYSSCCDQITLRFVTFYRSFATVMGAQIIIAAINTAFTAMFVLFVRLPNATVVIGLTFLCGLLPVIGNLISNAIIVGIAFTVSPNRALVALIFLIGIHKLEYFLNGKIIGGRIHNPMWLTLLALIVGEKLMGVPGMILAPVVLYYVKVEGSRLPATKESFALSGSSVPKK
jgi:predicted PurR-regulated permease PerM